MDKSELQQQNILNSIADGVFTVDLDWNITSFNHAAEKITGIPWQEAIGKKCFEVFHADICHNGCILKKSIEGNKEFVNLRVNILNAEQQSVPISISTAVLRDEKGCILGGAETFRDLSALETLHRQRVDPYRLKGIVSKNREILKILEILPIIAQSESTVLIEGPSGSGKEVFARAIHGLSQRKKCKYVVVSCGALPDTLLESELFGYVKGAFTDAKKDKAGRFTLAENGTILLDEIGDISPALQIKLLRVLQEREYEPLGGTHTLRADVRIIAATNKNLSEQVNLGRIRQDLYYRLNVIKIILPPLSRRREDIPLLIEHFIRKFNTRLGKEIWGMSPAALEILMKYDFPGNIRELENIVEHAFVLCSSGEIQVQHLPREPLERSVCPVKSDGALSYPVHCLEAEVIRETLRRNSGNREKTAQELGIHKTTLWRKMKKYGLE